MYFYILISYMYTLYMCVCVYLPLISQKKLSGGTNRCVTSDSTFH